MAYKPTGVLGILLLIIYGNAEELQCEKSDLRNLDIRIWKLRTEMHDLGLRINAMEKTVTELKTEIQDKTSTPRCQNGWTRYNGSCYLFVDHLNLSWEAGTEHCANLSGSHLAIMEAYREQEFLQEQVKQLENSVGSGKWFWVGATFSLSEGNWVWQPGGKNVSDGGSRWYPGQPDHRTSKDCGCLWGDVDYTFHDHYCSRAGYIICEKEMAVVP